MNLIQPHIAGFFFWTSSAAVVQLEQVSYHPQSVETWWFQTVVAMRRNLMVRYRKKLLET
jgi:hypothetical protein